MAEINHRPSRRQARRKPGVVLSGGGAKGAYEVGVLKALLPGESPATSFRPVVPEVYSGTSVGSYNATFLACRSLEKSDVQALAELERVWRERIAETPDSCGNGVFRIRGLPAQSFDPSCLLHPLRNALNLTRDAVHFTGVLAAEARQFASSESTLGSRVLAAIDLSAFISAEPLAELIGSTISLDGLLRSRKGVSIVASNLETGEPQIFSKAEIAADGTKAIQASAAIPGIFPPVVVGGQRFADGGVTINTPCLPAVRDGARELHVIFLDPSLRDLPLANVSGTFDTFYRLYVVLIANNVSNDIDVFRRFNVEIGRLAKLRLAGKELARALKEIADFSPVAKSLIGSSVETLPDPVVVHIYRPKTALGGAEGLLDFRLSSIQKSIELGYAETLEHDCEAEGCVLAQAEARAAA